MKKKHAYQSLIHRALHHPLNQLGWLRPVGLWMDVTVGWGGDLLWALMRGWRALGFEKDKDRAQQVNEWIQSQREYWKNSGQFLGVFPKDGLEGLLDWPDSIQVVYADWPFPKELRRKRAVTPQNREFEGFFDWESYLNFLQEFHEQARSKRVSVLILKLPIASQLSRRFWKPHQVIKSPGGQVQWWLWRWP